MLLENINSPADIRNLSIDQQKQLCEEIRQYMVECCAKNPGHLGSSLGAVELIVALHTVYNTPKDKLIFDVGHQAYAHKILTGRREAFRKNRTRDGISGFPNRSESPYDPFGAGHSSTAISAALGFAEAARLQHSGERVVALLGDGALTGGLAWEGLNNAGTSKANLLVILNDNNMSIDQAIGGVHDYLLRITTSSTYNKVKGHIWNRLGESKLRDWVSRRVVDTKSNLVRGSGGAIFESLGFRYFGPIDGNDIEQVTETLRRLRDLKGPRILHVITKKGKGYAPAEADPTTWHAPGRFDPATGARLKTAWPAARYQDVFGEVLVDLARLDPKVVGITPAMATGCGMNRLETVFPDRFFDVGIAEGHMVAFAAGLAAGGMRPVVAVYSTFLQRAVDQVMHDVAISNLPVVFCVDRAGVVGADGVTHQGLYDIAMLRCLPNVTICQPKDADDLKALLKEALDRNGPTVIRYPRGKAPTRPLPNSSTPQPADSTARFAIWATGDWYGKACEVASRVGGVAVHARYLKPFDGDLLAKQRAAGMKIVSIENGAVAGGCGEEIGADVKFGWPDAFIPHGTQAELEKKYGLDVESIVAYLTSNLCVSASLR